jgi:hypothetical protein
VKFFVERRVFDLSGLGRWVINALRLTLGFFEVLSMVNAVLLHGGL